MNGCQGPKATMMLSAASKVSYCADHLEPIEQNVFGSKGIYELIYFVKDSRSLDRF